MHNVNLTQIKTITIISLIAYFLVACTSESTDIIRSHVSLDVDKENALAGETLTYTMSLEDLSEVPLINDDVIVYVSLDLNTTYIAGSGRYFVGEESYQIPDHWISDYTRSNGDRLRLGHLNLGSIETNKTYAIVYSVLISEDTEYNDQIESKAQVYVHGYEPLAYGITTNVISNEEPKIEIISEDFAGTPDHNFSLNIKNTGNVDAHEVTIHIVPPVPEIGTYGYVVIKAKNMENPVEEIVWWDQAPLPSEINQGSIIINGNTVGLPGCHSGSCIFGSEHIFRQPLLLGSIDWDQSLNIVWVDSE